MIIVAHRKDKRRTPVVYSRDFWNSDMDKSPFQDHTLSLLFYNAFDAVDANL
jgi:hypothetical protein